MEKAAERQRRRDGRVSLFARGPFPRALDIATHALLPMAGALAALGFLRRDQPAARPNAAVAAVFGIAGFAPDLDGLIDGWSARYDALYWLQHRGVSHTLVGAPIFALVVLAALVALARLWPRRFSLFAWRRALVPAAVLGSWTHLVLDGITYSGVPLLWPFAFGRVGFPLFHWLVFWLLPIGGLALLLHAFGRLSRRGVIATGAVVAVILIVIAGARATLRPADVEGDALVFSRNQMNEWTILDPSPNGTWRATLLRDGVAADVGWFEPDEPPAAADAIARARDTGAYKGFLMGSFGPTVIVAEPSDDGWRVTFTDVAQRWEALHDPRWTPTMPHDEWGYVQFLVDGTDVTVLHRGW